MARLLRVAGIGISFVASSFVGKKDRARERLFAKLLSLGGIYVKFLQLLVVRDDPDHPVFSRLKNSLGVFDQVPFERIEIQQLLNRELGEKAMMVKLDSLEPFAAGSFAQVYLATLATGEEVVVKVLRPSASRTLKFDLKMISLLRSVSSLASTASMFDSKAVLHEFKRMTLKETDYILEAAAGKALAERHKNSPVTHIPVVHEGLSTKRIIVQERIIGMPLTELLASQQRDKVGYVRQVLNTDLDYVMEVLAEEFLAGSMQAEGAHGDPHPGNIYLLGNNKVGLIDFGIVSVAKRDQKELMDLVRQYARLYAGEFNPDDFAYAMIKYYVPSLTHSFETLASYVGRSDLSEELLSELVEESVEQLSSRGNRDEVEYLLGKYRMSLLFTNVINRGNRFALKADMQELAFLRSVQIFLNLIDKLGCDKQLLRRSWERVSSDYQVTLGSGVVSYDNESIDKSMHWIAEWFEKLRYSDPALYNKIGSKLGGRI